MTPPVVLDGSRLIRWSLGAAVLGTAGLLIGAAVDRAQLFLAYLVAYAYVASIAVGALIFLMIGHAMRAGWPVAVRRLTETITAVMPLLAVLFVPLLFGLSTLYPWLRPDTVASEHARHLIEHRRPYLNLPFFLVRAALYLAIWIAVAALLRRWSLRRDAGARTDDGPRMQALSAGALPAVGLAMSFASFDWLMGLEASWYTTMYPVYYFAGGFLGAIALLTIAAFAAQRAGLVPLGESHYYALGRLLLAFTIFWAYAAFFQFMLIWIANIPEEAEFYTVRMRAPWSVVSVMLLVLNFALPFLVLLSYRLKRRPAYLTAVAVWLLAFHYVDVHWLAAPTFRGEGLTYHWLDLAALAAVGGASVAFAAWRLRGRPALPVNDPRLPEALRYESL